MKIEENRIRFKEFNLKYKNLFPNFKDVKFIQPVIKESHHLINWRTIKYP